MQQTNYILEKEDEFDRLEYQSTLPKYDFKKEFMEFHAEKNQYILDAGSGSGIVSRYFAEVFPKTNFKGVDFSNDRVEKANSKAKEFNNLSFEQGDLSDLTIDDETFDACISRYVLEHIPPEKVQNVVNEIYRVLKPGARFYAVDFDGPLYNIYPQTALMEKALRIFRDKSNVDLRVGRKMPYLLSESGFTNITHRIETVDCQGPLMEDEKSLWPDKLDRLMEFMTMHLDSEAEAKQFKEDYIKTLDHPGVVLFYNKFTVIGEKPRLNLV
jgi:ubiquinone/menaquinone biosynthesis C-methylase UbiE